MLVMLLARTYMKTDTTESHFVNLYKKPQINLNSLYFERIVYFQDSRTIILCNHEFTSCPKCQVTQFHNMWIPYYTWNVSIRLFLF